MEASGNEELGVSVSLQKPAKQLKEVTTIAAEEAEKSKSAKEVIKSLTAQVRYIYTSISYLSEVHDSFSILVNGTFPM